MQKIPTMFARDESKRGRPVIDQIKPECQWVLDSEGIATAKIDGTNVKIENGILLKRRKPKDRDYDDAAYVPCERTNPADKWAFEAADVRLHPDGIYELIGPKVQGNPHRHDRHELVSVVPPSHSLRLMAVQPPRTFDGLRAYFAGEAGVVFDFEGIVFHHPDGRMAKIKRRDFGLPWPVPATD